MRFKISTPIAIHELGQRSNQEDAIYPRLGEASPKSRLFLVCDGMGGHEHGEVASNAVADAMSRYIREHFSADDVITDDMLYGALETAYQELDRYDSGNERKMGTTLTLLCMHRGGVMVAHVGDSRIYHLRPATGEILYISRDHSLVMDLYQAGEISLEEMHTSQKKNVITRAMTPGIDNRCKADVVHITDVKPDDYFLLCTDGMLEQMTDSELLNIVADNTTDEEKREVLVNATQSNKDNHSAYLIHVQEVVAESMDASQPNDEKTSKFNAVNIFKQIESHEIGGEDDDVSVIPLPPPFTPKARQEEKQNDVSIVSSPHKREFSLKPFFKWIAAAVALILLGLVFFLTKGNKDDKCAQGKVGGDSCVTKFENTDSAKPSVKVGEKNGNGNERVNDQILTGNVAAPGTSGDKAAVGNAADTVKGEGSASRAASTQNNGTTSASNLKHWQVPKSDTAQLAKDKK